MTTESGMTAPECNASISVSCAGALSLSIVLQRAQVRLAPRRFRACPRDPAQLLPLAVWLRAPRLHRGLAPAPPYRQAPTRDGVELPVCRHRRRTTALPGLRPERVLRRLSRWSTAARAAARCQGRPASPARTPCLLRPKISVPRR